MQNTPLIFEPLSMERVWGGRRLESLFGKPLPQGSFIGEMWMIVDRPEAQSVVHSGELMGLTLNELWNERREEIFGDDLPNTDRFPLLVKLLDARERLSVQVHPPEGVAALLEGEPKTEMWYFLHTEPGAVIYAGLRKGYTREDFEALLRKGSVEPALHRITVGKNDSIFIPSGRLHAIGEGCVIAEIQQNSDTTYRVHDWNRVGLDGQPRDLHVEQSLASIDFDDFEPALSAPRGECLAECSFFSVERWHLKTPRKALERKRFALFVCVEGRVRCEGSEFKPADFWLVPAGAQGVSVEPASEFATVLRAVIP